MEGRPGRQGKEAAFLGLLRDPYPFVKGFRYRKKDMHPLRPPGNAFSTFPMKRAIFHRKHAASQRKHSQNSLQGGCKKAFFERNAGLISFLSFRFRGEIIREILRDVPLN